MTCNDIQNPMCKDIKVITMCLAVVDKWLNVRMKGCKTTFSMGKDELNQIAHTKTCTPMLQVKKSTINRHFKTRSKTTLGWYGGMKLFNQGANKLFRIKMDFMNNSSDNRKSFAWQ
jgi:hypothetical protein